MSELVFTLENLFTIGGGVIATGSTFLKLKYDQKAQSEATKVRFETIERENEKEIANVEEKLIHITNGKRAMKKDLTANFDKAVDVLNKRVDKANLRIDIEKEANQCEFKSINENLFKIVGLLESQKK